MANAVLFVSSSKKLDAAAEKEIKEKLEGKRLTVILSSAEVDEKRSLTDQAAVEAKVTKILLKLVPALFTAKKLDFRRSITVAGAVKLLVKTENERPYPCTLQLEGPPPTKATPSVFRMENLVQCEFDAVMGSRALWIEVGYSIADPNAGRIIQNCDAALAKLEKEMARRVTDLVGKTVLLLNDGLASAGSKAMDWDGAEKLVDQLNRDIQRQIDGVYKEAEARLAAKEGKSVPGGIQVDVVARFDKFKLDKTLNFPGGSPPSVDEKSLKHLVKYAGQVTKELKDFADIASLVAAFDTECTKAAEKPQAPPQPGSPAGNPALNKAREQLLSEFDRVMNGMKSTEKQVKKLETMVKAIVSKLEKAKPQSPDAEKEHGKKITHLKNIQKAAESLEGLMDGRVSSIEAAVKLLNESDGPLPRSGLRQLGEVAEKGVLRSLAGAGAKLESTCKKVQAELKD